jgi:hypothetical protein
LDFISHRRKAETGTLDLTAIIGIRFSPDPQPKTQAFHLQHAKLFFRVSSPLVHN